MDVRRFRKNASDFGWPAALQAAAQGAVNRVVPFRVLKCVEVSEVDANYLTLEPRFQHRFLDLDTLRRASAEPCYDMSPRFLDQVLAKGDQCYGILDGDRLASLGWYSRQPTMISRDLCFHFDARCVYMYKGYTHPDYRGRRLYPIGMTQALKRFRECGAVGLVAYVDANNFNSLRSCYRIGCHDVGQIYFARTGDRYWVHVDAGCRNSGISVESA